MYLESPVLIAFEIPGKTNQSLVRRDFYLKGLSQGRERDYCNRENAVTVSSESTGKSTKTEERFFLGKKGGKQRYAESMEGMSDKQGVAVIGSDRKEASL